MHLFGFSRKVPFWTGPFDDPRPGVDPKMDMAKVAILATFVTQKGPKSGHFWPNRAETQSKKGATAFSWPYRILGFSVNYYVLKVLKRT